jgi:hypothetical protein
MRTRPGGTSSHQAAETECDLAVVLNQLVLDQAIQEDLDPVVSIAAALGQAEGDGDPDSSSDGFRALRSQLPAGARPP